VIPVEPSYRERLTNAVENLKSWGWQLDAELLAELIDVADGLLKRAESSIHTDNTELMQRARRLLNQ
jgi:hypothetical protein